MVRKVTYKTESIPSFISSVNPSYTKLPVPYWPICQDRLRKSNKKYEKQFRYELEMQEAMQYCAYDAMRFNRHFAITTMWPPLHTRKEIYYTLNNMFKLPSKDQSRLNEILENDVI